MLGKADLIMATTGNVNLTGISLEVGQENGKGGYLANHDCLIVKANEDAIQGEFQGKPGFRHAAGCATGRYRW